MAANLVPAGLSVAEIAQCPEEFFSANQQSWHSHLVLREDEQRRHSEQILPRA